MTKEEKRRAIALEAYPMILREGLEKFSLNTLLKVVNMSKGNFYHYFDHKNDLLYEIVVWQYGEIVEQYMYERPKAGTFEEKLMTYFAMYMSESEQSRNFLQLIQDMHLIFANREYEKLSLYIDQVYIETFDELNGIIDDEIAAGNICATAQGFGKTISATADGLLLYSFMVKEFDLKTELTRYLNTIAAAFACKETSHESLPDQSLRTGGL
jgi:AcrR family transcriptional regulator